MSGSFSNSQSAAGRKRPSPLVDLRLPTPIVTFTFDRAPRSALAGAEILERVGARGGFYVASSQMGQRDAVCGDMIRPEDIQYLERHGHEVGAMTHTHLDCSRATVDVIRADTTANFAFLRAAGLRTPPRTLAWPDGESSPAARQWALQRFAAARGAQAGVNLKQVDRSNLRATLLTSHEESRQRAAKLVQDCVRTRGWLIFRTHDVRSAPGELGVSLRHFAEVLQLARNAGASILPPLAAAEACGLLSLQTSKAEAKRPVLA